jgi:hypothetical protein
MTRHCDGCGRPLELARVLSRRYRKLRSGPGIGMRSEILTLICECGSKLTKYGTVTTMALHTRTAA